MPPAQTRKPSFALSAMSIASFSFGLTMFVLSIAYAKDLATLASVPLAIWSALCGQPSDNPLTLPILVSLSALSVVIGIALVLVNVWRTRRR